MIVYKLEDRLNEVYMHWFLFVMAGLRDLDHLSKPLYFHTKITENFQRETLELLKPDYIYVENILPGSTVVKCHGAPLEGTKYAPAHYYPFVRNLILDRNNLGSPRDPFRLLYISRNKVNSLAWRQRLKQKVAKRLVNELEVYDKLKDIGFDFIFLEDYSLLEKIRLFQEAKVIVTPSGGGLTTCFFAHQKTQVIELRVDDWDQYNRICVVLGIPVTVYSNIKIVDVDTQDIAVNDVDDLLQYVQRYTSGRT
jgi:capsular polysaccharide biosynthesis protein